MGYYDTNTALAYDFEPAYQAPAPRAPEPRERPHFDILTGAGREASQEVSPVFVHVVRVFCILMALVCVIGLARVTIASATTAMLNENAQISNALSTARDQSGDLEVMRSVYGADTRIRDLATDTLGMVEPDEVVTLDLTGQAAASSAAQAE